MGHLHTPGSLSECADATGGRVREATGEVNLRDLRRVLVEKFRAPHALVASIESQLRDHTIISTPSAPSAMAIRDPDDAWVLATALASEADVFVTGDQDLLAIAGAVSLPLLTPDSRGSSCAETPTGCMTCAEPDERNEEARCARIVWFLCTSIPR